jgi:glycosyltransferase involved in cell wall biosynthesis
MTGSIDFINVLCLISGVIESKESLAWKYVSDEEYYGCMSADATIVPTDWLSREMEQFAVPPEKLAVILYGMDIHDFGEKTKLPLTGPAAKKSTFTISCPARLVPVKGHRTLLGALCKLASDASWHCWLIGDGQLRRDIEQMIQDYGLTDRITLLGDRNDVPSLLKLSNIMVLPSL